MQNVGSVMQQIQVLGVSSSLLLAMESLRVMTVLITAPSLISKVRKKNLTHSHLL